MSSQDIIIAKFNKVNANSRTRYPTRDIRVSEQIKNEEHIRANELKYIYECKEKDVSKEQFLSYIMSCISNSEMYLSMMKRILTQAKKIEESTGKDINECIKHLMYDVNGNWSELYSKNENKRCFVIRKIRMSSNTYDYRVGKYFNRIDNPRKKTTNERYYPEWKKNLDVQRQSKKDNEEKKDKKDTSSTKSLKQKKEEIFENGEVAMVLCTAGDGIVITTLKMLDEKKFNINKVNLETVKYANSLRFKKVATKRRIPTKLDHELVENSNFVLISGGRVMYVYEGNMHRQIIKHWTHNIFGGNGIDQDIIFEEESDEESYYDLPNRNKSENDSDDSDDSDDESEDDFGTSMFPSNAYSYKKRDKERKDKKRSADRKFGKSKKKKSKKQEYIPPVQYMQDLLNRLLVSRRQKEDDDFDFDESDEPRTARQSSTYSGPVISFYRPGVDSDSDENEEDDDDSEFEFEKEEEGAYGQKFNKVEDDGSEVWKDSDYESEGGVEADPSVMRDLGF